MILTNRIYPMLKQYERWTGTGNMIRANQVMGNIIRALVDELDRPHHDVGQDPIEDNPGDGAQLPPDPGFDAPADAEPISKSVNPAIMRVMPTIVLTDLPPGDQAPKPYVDAPTIDAELAPTEDEPDEPDEPEVLEEPEMPDMLEEPEGPAPVEIPDEPPEEEPVPQEPPPDVYTPPDLAPATPEETPPEVTPPLPEEPAPMLHADEPETPAAPDAAEKPKPAHKPRKPSK